jgi:2-polyprenyl-3-methyl-5-hydroxy-6-metoxy-1,4-benzoquinol methylase/uncharacterized protein YbaR (Trm112 family)
MKYRLIELLKSPDTGKPLHLKVFHEKRMEHSNLNLIRNPMCANICSLNGYRLSTKKKPNCKECYKMEIISGILSDGKNIYPIIKGVPRLLSRKMQHILVGYHQDFFKKYKTELANFNYGKMKFVKWGDKKINKTLKSYSHQWRTFDEIIPEWGRFYDYHLKPYNEPSFLKDKLILDVGCGFGRSVYYVASRGAEVVGFDLSEAVQPAYKFNTKFPHSHIVQSSIYEMPFVKNFDFIYSIGVIQHTPYKDLSFKKMADMTKIGKPLHVWVYSKRNWSYKFVYMLRPITTRMPYKPLHILCYFFAILQYTFLFIPHKILSKINFTKKIAKNIPYTHSADFPFRHTYANWFDKLSVPLTDEFSKKRVYNWFKKAGFEDIHIEPTHQNMAWRAWGVKKRNPK